MKKETIPYRQDIMEISQGDYVSFDDENGIARMVLPLGLPDYALCQFKEAVDRWMVEKSLNCDSII